MAYQPQYVPTSVIGSVQVLNFPGNQSVSGTVVVPFGSVVAFGGPGWGSVQAVQSTSPWIVNFQNPSILSVPVGSTIVYLQAPSIVGTYSEDATHTSADKGIFTLGVRNDTVASFVGADLEYSPRATDSAGRVLVKPYAAEEARIEGDISLTSTSVTTLVAAAGAGLKNYITDIWLANTGSVSTLVTFRSGGGTSVLGYTIVPAGGGSNLPGLVVPIRTLANETFGIQATSPTSTLYATVRGFKAP